MIGNFPSYFELYQKYWVEPLTVKTCCIIRADKFFINVHPILGGIASEATYCLAFVKLHNRGDKPIAISSYALSVEVGNHWERLAGLRAPPVRLGSIVAFPSGKYLTRVDLTESGFDYLAAQGPIKPNGTLTGWIWFASRASGKITRLRYEFVDEEQRVHILEIPFNPKKDEESRFTSLERLPMVFLPPMRQSIPPELQQVANEFCADRTDLCK
ncbi:MAG: hypothetical protein WA188_20150 [Terriglobales bacterium]